MRFFEVVRFVKLLREKEVAMNRNATLAAVVVALGGTTGCRAIEGIFKAGVWVGVVIVGFLALLAFGAMRLFARGS